MFDIFCIEIRLQKIKKNLNKLTEQVQSSKYLYSSLYVIHVLMVKAPKYYNVNM
jgi:hypothetical protein